MLVWLRHFLFIPISYLAAVGSILFISVEILGLTTAGIFKRGTKSAFQYWKMVHTRDEKPLTKSPTFWVVVGSVILSAYLMRRK